MLKSLLNWFRLQFLSSTFTWYYATKLFYAQDNLEIDWNRRCVFYHKKFWKHMPPYLRNLSHFVECHWRLHICHHDMSIWFTITFCVPSFIRLGIWMRTGISSGFSSFASLHSIFTFYFFAYFWPRFSLVFGCLHTFDVIFLLEFVCRTEFKGKKKSLPKWGCVPLNVLLSWNSLCSAFN